MLAGTRCAHCGAAFRPGDRAVEIAGKRYHDDDACAGKSAAAWPPKSPDMALTHLYCGAVARGEAAPIATKFARAKKDPIGTQIAACCEYGLCFRWSGAVLEVSGLDPLSDRDRALFELHDAEIISRTREPGGDDGNLIDQLEVWTEAVRTREHAAYWE